VVQHLLPVGNEAPRCSEFARSIAVLPRGTGLFLSRAILVSAPLPWPKPAMQHSYLRPSSALVNASAVPSRLFAAEPNHESRSAEGGRIDVEVFERSGAKCVLTSWTVDDPAAIEVLIGAVAQTELGALSTIKIDGARQIDRPDQVGPTFLICTQGSHDTCCGTSGVALADQLVDERSHYTIRRVSHTGGHRFSPTLLAFPEGRMWAYADMALVDRIAAGAETADDFVYHCRGWWGAKVGPAQVAECAVRAQRAGSPFVEPTIESSETDPSDSMTRFRVGVGAKQWRVDVTAGRDVPTVTCEAPGGLPAKPGREFHWDIAPI